MAETIVSGLVVQKQELNSADALVTVLTKDERLVLLARGVRKVESKNASALQLGNFIVAEIFKSRLHGKISRLKRATIALQPPLLLGDTATIVFEVMRLLQNAPHASAIFLDLLKGAYAYFGYDYNYHIKTFVYFHALELWGMQPNLEMCVQCGTTQNIVDFDFASGGFLCQKHTKHRKTLEYLQAMRNIKAMFTYKFTAPEINQEIFANLLAYYQEQFYI